MIHVRVQYEPIDLAAESARVEERAAGAGAVATFSGHVRGSDGVTALELDHYPGMTETALGALAAEARERWQLDAVSVVHRVGRMLPGERIVLVVAAATHRGAALDACAALIDLLKTRVPFWKCEERGGVRRWVEHREADTTAAARWR